jgi:dolichol-phosphate mannosyltransferase
LLSFKRQEEMWSVNPRVPAGLRSVDLAVVLPTYNERDNISLVIARLAAALQGLRWQAIFVDDDSPDGTADTVAAHSVNDDRIRLIHRVGQRGLASACIDGILATDAPYVAVMDADLQHDETVLPRMLARLRNEALDVVVGTRNAQGGSMGQFSPSRVLLSRLGQRIGHIVCRCRLTDPMSGFFMVRRSFFVEAVPSLQRGGFKILVDLLASTRQPAKVGEVGYTFSARRHGESKLDVFVGIEYLSLVCSKLVGGFLPLRLGLFLLVGGIGLITHLLSLTAMLRVFHLHFTAAQVIATFVAMIGNFFFNNIITFRDRRLRGRCIVTGLATFVLTCSVAAWANVAFARQLWQNGVPAYAAGLAGIVLGSIWNLTVSSHFTWRVEQRALIEAPVVSDFASEVAVFATDFEVTR